MVATETKLTFRLLLICIIAEFNFLPIYKKHINRLYFGTISHTNESVAVLSRDGWGGFARRQSIKGSLLYRAEKNTVNLQTTKHEGCTMLLFSEVQNETARKCQIWQLSATTRCYSSWSHSDYSCFPKTRDETFAFQAPVKFSGLWESDERQGHTVNHTETSVFWMCGVTSSRKLI